MGSRQWDNMHQLVWRSWFDSSFFFLSSLFFLCCFVSTSFISFVQLLYCLIAFCIFFFFMWLKLEFWKSQWPFLWKTETDQNRLKSKYHRNRQFPTISIGFGWEFHKPKYSVSVGHTHTKPTEPNRAHPYSLPCSYGNCSNPLPIKTDYTDFFFFFYIFNTKTSLAWLNNKT